MTARAATALVALAACTTTELVYHPIAADALRARAQAAGEPTLVRARQGERVYPLPELAAACAGSACPLDSPLGWEVGEPHRRYDGEATTSAVIGAGLVGLLVYGNVVCFGGGHCDSGDRWALGATDAVIAIGVIGFTLLVIETVRHPPRPPHPPR